MKLISKCCILFLIAEISARNGQEVYDFQTLPPLPPGRPGSGSISSAPPASDALLTDWEGEHWASLDADLDKVALSWNVDEDYITFQVSEIIENLCIDRQPSHLPVCGQLNDALHETRVVVIALIPPIIPSKSSP